MMMIYILEICITLYLLLALRTSDIAKEQSSPQAPLWHPRCSPLHNSLREFMDLSSPPLPLASRHHLFYCILQLISIFWETPSSGIGSWLGLFGTEGTLRSTCDDHFIEKLLRPVQLPLR